MSTQPAEEGKPLQTIVRKTMTDEERQRRRELEKRYLRYKCHECDATYEDDYDAKNCCGPDSVYVCPSCDEHHYSIESAQECEAGHGVLTDGPLSLSRCPVCKEPGQDVEDAIECCLWKTMPHADRLDLERLVRCGRTDEANAIVAARLH
jgi:rubrerythrin